MVLAVRSIAPGDEDLCEQAVVIGLHRSRAHLPQVRAACGPVSTMVPVHRR
jgi:hypothetical protein